MNSRHFCWVNSMKDRKKPAIRFKGFTEDWEQRKLGEITDRVVRKNINNESTLPLTISAQYGLIDQVIYFNNRVASRDVSNYYLVLNGEFAYNKSTSDGFPYGAVKRLDLYRKGVLSTLYIVFCIKNKKKTNSDFLTFFFDTDRWHKGVYERAAEGARNHGLLNISADDFFDIDLFLPKSEQEQAVIGAYFKQLDNLITLHQRKYDKLVNVKKSMLEKMFPRDGKFVPDVRFSGFTEDWEQRKLGDVVGITSGFMGDSLLSDGKYHLTRIETIADGIVDENRVGYSNEKPDDMYLLKHGDILYSNINSISHMGKVAKYQGNSPLYHGINLLRLQPENNINSDFLLYLLNTEKCRNWAKTRANQAVSQASINQSLLTTQEIAISSFEEQKKIGDYFRNLDNLITLHQRKLEKLKNIKKSCLVKMFI